MNICTYCCKGSDILERRKLAPPPLVGAQKAVTYPSKMAALASQGHFLYALVFSARRWLGEERIHHILCREQAAKLTCMNSEHV